MEDSVQSMPKRRRLQQESSSTLVEVQQWNISQVIEVLNAIDKVKVNQTAQCPWVTGNVYFERPMYVKLMNCIAQFITSPPKPGVVRVLPIFMILGTPGVGKTLFLLYAVKYACNVFEGDAGVVYITSEGFFVITRREDGLYAHAARTTIPEGALVVCDIANRSKLPQTPRVDCHMIISSSVGQYHTAQMDFEWLKRSHCIGMDTWGYDELASAFKDHSMKDRVLKGFRYCGGSLRTLLYETPVDGDFDAHHARRIQLELLKVTTPIQLGPGQMESLKAGLYNIYHFRWTPYQTDTRIFWNYSGYWATNFVQQQVAEKYLTLSRAQTNALIDTTVGEIKGKLFEESLHVRMAKKDKLVATSRNGEELIICCDRFDFIELEERKQCDSSRERERDSNKALLQENVWYRPTQGNFGTADALVLMAIPTGTAEASIPSGTAEASIPEASIPSGTAEASIPSGTAEASIPSGTAEASIPSGTAEASIPSGTAESKQLEYVLCGIQSTISRENDDMSKKDIEAFLNHCPSNTKKYYHVFYSPHGVSRAKPVHIKGIEIKIYNHCTLPNVESHKRGTVMSDEYLAETVERGVRLPKHLLAAWLKHKKCSFTSKDTNEDLLSQVRDQLVKMGKISIPDIIDLEGLVEGGAQETEGSEVGDAEETEESGSGDE